jgi:hypothetical protein
VGEAKLSVHFGGGFVSYVAMYRLEVFLSGYGEAIASERGWWTDWRVGDYQ